MRRGGGGYCWGQLIVKITGKSENKTQMLVGRSFRWRRNRKLSTQNYRTESRIFSEKPKKRIEKPRNGRFGGPRRGKIVWGSLISRTNDKYESIDRNGRNDAADDDVR